MLFMSICDLFRVEFSKFKIFSHFWSYGAKTAKIWKKSQIFTKSCFFFTQKFWFFVKHQWIHLCHFLRSFAWNFQNLRFLKIYEVMGQKPVEIAEISKFPWKIEISLTNFSFFWNFDHESYGIFRDLSHEIFEIQKFWLFQKLCAKNCRKKSKFPLLQKLLSFSNFLG